MSDVIVAPSTRELDELQGQLEQWLEAKIGAPVTVANLTYPRGAGQSHETILFDARWSEGIKEVEQGFVVRIKPTGFTVFPDDLFEQQYRIMQVMREHGAVRVAKTFWYEEDPALLGAPFFIMEKLAGRVPVSVPPYRDSGWVAEATPAQRRRMWEAGVRQLAAIQSVPLDKVPFLAGTEGARDGLAQEWDKYVRFVSWLEEHEPQPILRRAIERLKGFWPKNQPPGIVWGDARLGNMMFDTNFDVIAVMDWEQPSLGGALHDLSWFRYISKSMHGAVGDKPHLAGMGSDEELLELWQQLTGISLDDLDWYEDFTALKVSCTGQRLQHLRGTRMYTDEWLAKRLKVN